MHQFTTVYHSNEADEAILFVLKQSNEVQHKAEGVSNIILYEVTYYDIKSKT